MLQRCSLVLIITALFVTVLYAVISYENDKYSDHVDIDACPHCGCQSLPRSEVADGSTFRVVRVSDGKHAAQVLRCEDDPRHWWVRWEDGMGDGVMYGLPREALGNE